VLLYPYLVPLLDDKVFKPFSINKSQIEKIAKDIIELGKSKKLYEAMSYSLFFSLKYDFLLTENLFEKVESSHDSVLLLLAYLHNKKFTTHSSICKQYKKLANTLKDDIDEYWIFVYEVLSVGNLKSDWKQLKQANVTFIKSEFL
jgi:hypothetical protein